MRIQVRMGGRGFRRARLLMLVIESLGARVYLTGRLPFSINLVVFNLLFV